MTNQPNGTKLDPETLKAAKRLSYTLTIVLAFAIALIGLSVMAAIMDYVQLAIVIACMATVLFALVATTTAFTDLFMQVTQGESK